jgi:hypothetical protein
VEPSDVHTIAREMRDELGVDAPLAAVPSDYVPPAPEPSRSNVSHDLAIRRLEERIERVERTLGATVDLLHNILHPDKAKPGAPTGD